MLRYFILALLLCMPYRGLGQGVPALEENIWTRRVCRTISIGDTVTDENRRLIDQHKDSLLVELLIKSAAAGKITAYNPFTSSMVDSFTKKQLEDYINPQPDPDHFPIEDPVVGQTIHTVVSNRVRFDNIKKYRVLENWTFNQKTKETTIQIIGIAPLEDVYGSDGDFRGSAFIMWFRYDAGVKNIIRQYEQTHKEISLTSSIWYDYFSGNRVFNANKTLAVFNGESSNIISLVDSIPFYGMKLFNYNFERQFSQILMDSILAGAIHPYLKSDLSFTNVLTKEKITAITSPITDTVVVDDPITDKKIDIVSRRDFDPTFVTSYKIIQKWQMDRATGKTTIKPIGIIPILYLPEKYRTNKEGIEMFMLKFEDVNNIIKRFQIVRPEDNVALRLWLSYFSERE